MFSKRDYSGRIRHPYLLLLLVVIITGCTSSVIRQRTSLFDESGGISFFSARKTIEDARIVEGQNLFLMDEDGKQIMLVDDAPSSLSTYRVAWSPNGESVALVAYDNQTSSLCLGIMEQDKFRCLDSDGRTASWSPNGLWLAYHHRATPSSLVLIEINTGEKQKLVDLPQYRGISYWDSYSSWSPDGQQIVYDMPVDRDDEIWIVNLEGDTHFLTYGVEPAWSSNGNEIVFARNGNIWIYDLVDEQEQLVFEDASSSAENPVWMPDGMFLLFVSEQNNNTEIFRIDKYGNNLTNLTNYSGDDFLPSVKP